MTPCKLTIRLLDIYCFLDLLRVMGDDPRHRLRHWLRISGERWAPRDKAGDEVFTIDVTLLWSLTDVETDDAGGDSTTTVMARLDGLVRLLARCAVAERVTHCPTICEVLSMAGFLGFLARCAAAGGVAHCSSICEVLSTTDVSESLALCAMPGRVTHCSSICEVLSMAGFLGSLALCGAAGRVTHFRSISVVLSIDLFEYLAM